MRAQAQAFAASQGLMHMQEVAGKQRGFTGAEGLPSSSMTPQQHGATYFHTQPAPQRTLPRSCFTVVTCVAVADAATVRRASKSNSCRVKLRHMLTAVPNLPVLLPLLLLLLLPLLLPALAALLGDAFAAFAAAFAAAAAAAACLSCSSCLRPACGEQEQELL